MIGSLPHTATATTAAALEQGVAWGHCPAPLDGVTRDPKQECGTLRVPLDYQHPQGRTIDVAVSRIRATNAAKRAGVLMLNGGGPGPSLDVPSILENSLPASVRERYDLVGFDPRGVAHSTPMTCGQDSDALIRNLQLEILSFPAADGSITRNIDYARQSAQRCAAASGDLLPYLTTKNIARDMDRLREALGERTVSYYGVSWGTYLGSVYRALFPKTVDHMVIDSSVDPNLRGYDDFRTFSSAAEDRWPDLARFAATHPQMVELGSSDTQVRTNYLAATTALDKHPVTLPDTKATLDGNLVRMFTFELSYSDASMTITDATPVPPLAELWRAAVHFAHGTATHDDETFIAALSNDFIAKGTVSGVPVDNLYSVGYAISCADQAWPHDPALYARNTALDRTSFPLTAGAPANITACAFWPFAPVEPEATVTETGTRNVLILQNDRDPATPLRTAQGMRHALGHDASLVTVDAGGHGVLIHPNPNTCAISIMDTFLTSGVLPDGDPHCAAQ
ncbi:alpha/beta hydrolase [Kutzneria sp. CA-103260]|uniref:alpha/beta hydrolase n=1 Tax=Kutzneria sp. CA-103260 TaxID=2802641 RepID=UPI001BEE9FA0|nr:alpha/beta hydrolase [Kutzneria sp. CA-103260]QUQ65317.1 hydrolase [Kutzneria sp. CA-103260]